VEAVLGVRVPHDLRGLPRRGGSFAELLHLGHRDPPVAVAVEAEPRRPEAGRLGDERAEPEASLRDAGAVERDGRADVAARRGHERHGAAHAEADDTRGARRDAGRRDPRQRGVHVGEDLIGAQRGHHVACLPDLVVAERRIAAAVEQVRRHREVPGVREPPGDVDDVVVHAERLVDDDHRVPGSSRRLPDGERCLNGHGRGA
jgi:hypothetical protein